MNSSERNSHASLSLRPEPAMSDRPGRFLIVTWAGGGCAPPALGLGRELTARGHSVRILAPRVLRERIEAARCALRPFPAHLEWYPGKGRAYEDQPASFRNILDGPSLAEAVLAEVRRQPADALVVDCMLRNALSAAEAVRLPTAALVHLRFANFVDGRDHAVGGWDFQLVNRTRERLGIQPIHGEDERPVMKLLRSCSRLLIMHPREFEDFRGPLPPNARYVGPVFEHDAGSATLDLPWPPDHPDPLVVVAFSSTYMHHETVMGRVLAALEPLRVRVLVTLGGGLEPHEVPARPGMAVSHHLPHTMVLPHASLVVTHAGVGTIMAAFACGVPMLCMPLGREQPGNAEQVRALGAGRMIAPHTPVEDVRAAIVDVLGSDALRAGARRMAESVAGYGRGHRAIHELEGLLVSPGSA